MKFGLKKLFARESAEEPTIDKALDEYSKNTSIHGIKYWGEKNRSWPEKIFWMVIFAVSIYFCLSNVLEINEHRKNRPVMLSFSKTKLQNFDTPFPSVTICLEEKIKKSEIDLSEARRNSIFQNISQVKMQALAQICHFDNDQHFMEILNISHPITKNLTKVIEEISLSDYEIFSKCHLGTEKNVDCRKIFQKTITDEGICYSFNMLDHKDLLTDKIDDSLRYPIVDKKSSWFLSKDYEKGDIDAYPRRAIGYGIKDGIYVRLRMNISDFNPGCKRSTRGFRVKIHLPVDYPTISRSYYSIPFNKQTMLMLTPNMVYSSKDIKVYEPQARKCYFPGERKLDFFKIYTKLSCDSECLAKKVIEACGCVEFSMPRDNSTEICDTTKIPCVHKAKKNYQMLSLNKKLLSKQLKRQLANGEIKDDDKKFKELKKMKTCDCLPACVSIDYSAEIQEIDILQDNMKHSDSLTASFNIFFKDSSFVRLKRYEIYGFSDFLSSTGGIFGLFLGCSVLSFVEIFYHFMAYLCKKCVPKKIKSTTAVESINENNNTIQSIRM